MIHPPAPSTLLDRTGLVLVGLVLALEGAGVFALGLRGGASGAADLLTGALVGMALIAAGARVVGAAVRTSIPRWYAELVVFGGGVFVGGARRTRS